LSRLIRCVFILLLGFGLFDTERCEAQAASADPVVVLGDTLAAACAQNSVDFSQALTLRNAQAFSRLTAAARSTLLKRFALLDKPGQARTERDPSGALTVFCATPEVTTEMRIGKPEAHDNLVYLPLVVRSAEDKSGESARRVTMGLVREDGRWKLLSLGLLLLDIPALGEEWDRAEIKTNEEDAIASMKKLAAAIETYRKTYTRLPDTLEMLGPARGGAKAERAGLVEEELAVGKKNGYAFRYVVVGAGTLGAPAKYELAAIPLEYGRTGLRSFFQDDAGVTHAADRQGSVGSSLDPKLE